MLSYIKKNQNVSLYVHIPFCSKKCFYCSFVVSVHQEKRIEEYLNALETESQLYLKQRIDTLYLGGGTPTLLNEYHLEKLFKSLALSFQWNDDCEITIEANPKDLSMEKAKALKKLGINRVSLGVQSLNDRYLQYLGRNHRAEDAIKTFETLRDAGFTNMNIDLMYGFPDQTMDELDEDLRGILSLSSEHLSLYSLMIEPNSKFFARSIKLPHQDLQGIHYKRVIQTLNDYGVNQYEVSNFAKDGKESKHNINYWQGGEYVGLGVGAHSFIDNKRSSNVESLMVYLKNIKLKGSAVSESRELTVQEKFQDAVLFGLRMNAGINLSNEQVRFDQVLESKDLLMVKQLIKEGFLIGEGEIISATLKGRVVLDEICSRLF